MVIERKKGKGLRGADGGKAARGVFAVLEDDGRGKDILW